MRNASVTVILAASSSLGCGAAPPASTGRLDPGQIQRVVRNDFGRVRRCYEDTLRAKRDLETKVVVKFVIGRDGRVTSAVDQGNEAPTSMATCVVEQFRGLRFPSPEGGVVTVVYPILFTPGIDVVRDPDAKGVLDTEVHRRDDPRGGAALPALP
ncbi:MAG TPA: AgmX/PglI C-terminal domain-containing protein [Minicystis sp.]|nr:AgmX/PglI C-terminal domain-containing protein [Minicystis sp.]